MNKKRAMAGIGATAALLILGGCGKAVDKIAERAAEKAIGDAAGGDLDISGDGFTFRSGDGEISYQVDDDGNVVMRGPDGEVITADSDGNMTMSGPDGETTYTTGENAEVPDGWPRFLAPPDGATLLTSHASTEGDQRVGSITAEVDGPVEDTYEGYKKALQAEGFEIGSDSFTQSSGGDFASLSGQRGDLEVNIGIGSGSGDRPYLTISVSGL